MNNLPVSHVFVSLLSLLGVCISWSLLLLVYSSFWFWYGPGVIDVDAGVWWVHNLITLSVFFLCFLVDRFFFSIGLDCHYYRRYPVFYLTSNADAVLSSVVIFSYHFSFYPFIFHSHYTAPFWRLLVGALPLPMDRMHMSVQHMSEDAVPKWRTLSMQLVELLRCNLYAFSLVVIPKVFAFMISLLKIKGHNCNRASLF